MKRPTARAMQVVELMAQGMLNKEIAHRLHFAEGTTKVHLRSVTGRMPGTPNRVKLALWYLQQLTPEQRDAFINQHAPVLCDPDAPGEG